MRFILCLTYCSLLLVTNALYPQADRGKVLMTVNGKPVYASEFEWLYNKNNSGEISSSFDDYLELYKDFRLKVEAAAEAGIDKRPSFSQELAGYRKQLAKSYLTDQKVKEDLLLKAFERSRFEFNAYHILVRCPADAPPEDTLLAYNKAMSIRERVRLGEPFESVARGASDDPYVTMNGGNLGYFTVFQTPLTFEDAVYEMKPGTLSRPVRTSDGYHIIKVQDRRPSSGKVKVAHLMKATPMGANAAERERAMNEIDSLYNLATAPGTDFAELVKNNSDDMGSSQNGGELPWFGAGEMVSEFAESAFSLMHDGDIGKPVKTVYGWHIIKRLGRQSPLPFEEAKAALESKISQSYLATLSRKSFAEKLKREYNFRVDRSSLEWFYPVADSTFRSGGYQKGIPGVPGNTIYSFADRKVSMKDFAAYIKKMGSHSPSRDSLLFINTLLDMKSYDDLLAYEDSRLEVRYPEFRFLMNEFHDGIMLFEISDSLIWQRSASDSLGFMEYYEGRKTEFMSDATATATIYTVKGKAGRKRMRKIESVIRKYYKKSDADSLIMAGIDLPGDMGLTIEKGTFTRGENAVMDMVKWSKGLESVTDGDTTFFVNITDAAEAHPLSFEEMRGELSSDWIDHLEKNWILQLRERYPVIVNEQVLNELKQKYH